MVFLLVAAVDACWCFVCSAIVSAGIGAGFGAVLWCKCEAKPPGTVVEATADGNEGLSQGPTLFQINSP